MRVVQEAGPVRPQLGRDLAEELASARARLAARVAATVDGSGRARAPVCGRILETALTLRLLQLERVEPAAQDRLVGYLCRARAGPRSVSHDDEAERLEAAVLGWALGDGADDLDAAEDAFVAETAGFVAARKRWMTHALAGIFGRMADSGGTIPPLRTDSATPTAHWVPVLLSAFRVISQTSRGAAASADPDDVATLRLVVATPGIWERQILTHLVAAHALCRVEGGTPLIRDAIDQVLAFQRKDGGIPNIPDQDVFCTAIAGLALEGTTPWEPLRTRMAEYLIGEQQSDGGWGFSEGVRQTDVDDTSVCMEFLHSTAPRGHTAVADRAIRYLLRIQNGDGGFPTWIRGADSEPAMTAAALNALPPVHRGPAGAAVAFLRRSRLPNGAFAPGWSRSNANALFRAALGCRRHPLGGDELLHGCVDYIMRTANPDGGWGQQPGEPSDAISTAFSLITLCQGPSAGPVLRRGLRWFLDQQESDGSYRSRPDSRGPRPFLYDAPDLTNIYALLALTHVAHRYTPRATTPALAARIHDPSDSA
ncbi:prenyltransferase/squalene oxidase repeat-containing protein [Streptomyces sp. NPDC007861]|uniref:prenyltransferase/squalene oxidase repeat-containing protein n=1 Tax=Streptomyces sp. NPDC007861 TaxID=3154893 RepID=UPI0033EAFA07